VPLNYSRDGSERIRRDGAATSPARSSSGLSIQTGSRIGSQLREGNYLASQIVVLNIDSWSEPRSMFNFIRLLASNTVVIFINKENGARQK
jgi:hypothetical protein